MVMPLWFALTLISVIALAAAELLQQYLLNKNDPVPERLSAVFTVLLPGMMALFLVVVTGEADTLGTILHGEVFPRVFLVSFLASIGILFYFRSFRVRNISISTILVSCSVVVSTSIGVTTFEESTAWLKFVGIALVLGAVVILRWQSAVFETNHWFGLAAGAIFGMTYSLDKSITTVVSPLVYMAWAFPMVALWSFLLTPRSFVIALQATSIKAFCPIIASAVGYFIYNLCTFLAYRAGGEVGRIDAINNSQVFLIVWAEYLILRQRESIGRKFAAAAAAYAGIVLLGMA